MTGRVRVLIFGAAALLAPSLAHAEDDRVKVHMTGDSGLVLERRIEDTELWESLCVGACDAKVPLAGSYRLNGRGLRPSLPISLLPAPNVLRLEARPAYSAAMAGGITLVIVGPLAMIGGLVAATVGSNSQPETCNFSGCFPDPQSHASLIGGVLSLLTGALLTAAGGVALGFADHTSTRQQLSVSGRGLTVAF